MKVRKNYAELLKNTKLPFLYILGKIDNFIPANIYKHFELPANTTLSILDNSWHQTYIEEQDKTVEILLKFSNLI